MADDKITASMNIGDVINKYPETISVFARYNIGCIGCIAASFENIRDIALVHGIDVKTFLEELNAAVNS